MQPGQRETRRFARGHTRGLHPPRRPLLELDPDLGATLSEERVAAARDELRAAVLDVPAGAWRPASLLGSSRSNVGVLILAGASLRELSLGSDESAELLGAGDLVRTWHDEGLADEPAEWQAITPMTIALLDAHVTVALCRYPEVWLGILERVEARAQNLAVTQAISQMTGVDARLEALLRHLADRWGRVHPEGVRVPLNLSHRQLGALVGARRPTVSTALSLLAQQQRIWRSIDGSWMLSHERAGADDTTEPLGALHEPAAAA